MFSRFCKPHFFPIENKSNVKLYLIGGLGADERVFKYLKLNVNTKIIKWIDPEPSENLTSYIDKLADQIDHKENIGFLGVSFGGIIAVELSKKFPTKKLILISSITTIDQLPKTYIWIGKTGLINLIPTKFFKPPKTFLHFLFGAQNQKLLEEIIKDTKPTFIKWALNIIVTWSTHSNTSKAIRIHGTKDRLLPLKGKAIEIPNGGHFMIVDKYEEISKIVNDQIANSERQF